MVTSHETATDEQLRYVEQFGMAFEQIGLTPMAGRIMGWLLICEPPQQSMDALAEVLQASKSSISTSLQLLSRFGWVEQVAVPGERKSYYQLRSDVWTQILEFEMGITTRFRQLADQGLALVRNGASDSQAERIASMHELFRFYERELSDLIQRWKQGERE